MNARWPGMRRGVTLIEVTIAGTLLAILSLTFFEGVGLAARISQENAEYLAADAYAFDLAYKRSCESYANLLNVRNSKLGAVMRETISSNACPVLYREGNANAAQALTRINWAKTASGTDDPNALAISIDVEWGAANRRRLLSNRFSPAVIVKSGVGLRE